MATMSQPNGLQAPRMRLYAALAVAAVAVIAAAAVLLWNYGPWSDDDSPSAAEAARAQFPALAQQRGQADPAIEDLQQTIKENGDDFAAHLTLASLYLQKVRETGDPTYYTQADELLQDAAKLDASNPDLFALQGTLALGRHEFAAALDFGKKALVQDPDRAFFYGIVADAQVELGDYEGAVRSLQSMVDLKPDFAAYSRIAYARELYGDPEGAVEAMQLALEAGSTIPENVAWAHVQVGNLYLVLGRVEDAGTEFDTALARFPDYALATAGKAKVAAAQGDFARAQTLYQAAFDRMPLSEYAIGLGDVATRMGDAAAAESAYGLVRAIDQLYVANGTNTDLELGLFLADHGDPAEAVTRARAAYEAHPSIHAADVLGWSLFKSGDTAGAQQYADEALRLGTRDSVKLYHAAIITRANGDDAKARELLTRATSLNPEFNTYYATDAAKVLAELGGPSTEPAS